MGDAYEKQIGLEYEQKDTLVIYNGLIKGYKDRGIDILVLSKNKIELIQCKNWHKKILTLEALETISAKLDNYTLDFYNIKPHEINKYLKYKKKIAEIKTIIGRTREKKQKIKKILYLANAKVLEDKMTRKTLLYKDMEIIIRAVKEIED